VCATLSPAMNPFERDGDRWEVVEAAAIPDAGPTISTVLEPVVDLSLATRDAARACVLVAPAGWSAQQGCTVVGVSDAAVIVLVSAGLDDESRRALWPILDQEAEHMPTWIASTDQPSVGGTMALDVAESGEWIRYWLRPFPPETETDTDESEPSMLGPPDIEPIGEDDDTLRRRSDWFRRRHGPEWPDA